MRLCLLFLLCTCLLLVAHAQSEPLRPKLGIRGGASIANWAAPNEDLDFFVFSARTHPTIRLFGLLPLGPKIRISAEGGYTPRGFDVTIANVTSGVKVNFLDFNGTFQYQLSPYHFFDQYFGVGLTSAYALSATFISNGQSLEIDFSDDDPVKRFDFLVEPNVGLSFGRKTQVVLDFRYSIGLFNQRGEEDDNPDPIQFYNRGWLLTAGVAVSL